MMPTRPVVQLIAAVVVAVFVVGLWATGTPVEATWLRFYSAAVFAAVVVLGLFERYLWRIRVIQRWSFVPRDLRGTWRGILTSAWIDPQTGTPPAPKTAYLVIRQTFSSTSATLLTDEMTSRSLFARVTRTDGAVSLDYMYLSRPKLRVEHRSRMHHGSTTFDVAGRPAERLDGRYWTDRDSKGELIMTHRVSPTADDFGTAARLFASIGYAP